VERLRPMRCGVEDRNCRPHDGQRPQEEQNASAVRRGDAQVHSAAMRRRRTPPGRRGRHLHVNAPMNGRRRLPTAPRCRQGDGSRRRSSTTDGFALSRGSPSAQIRGAPYQGPHGLANIFRPPNEEAHDERPQHMEHDPSICSIGNEVGWWRPRSRPVPGYPLRQRLPQPVFARIW
jgi:hypothetical protein